MTTKPKIALLICGGLTGKAYDQNGDYYDVYLRYVKQSSPQGVDFIFDPYDVRVKMEYPIHEDDYSCMLLTGSQASAHEDLEWINKLVAYVKRIAETKSHIKLIGLCFGHQIIARALGGECVRNEAGWEVGPTAMQLTELGKLLFKVDTLTLNQMHRDHVSNAPPGFELLGSTALTPIQGMVRFFPPSLPSSTGPPKIQILTLQGHPEFTESVTFCILEQRTASGIIDEAIAQDAQRKRDWKTDGVDVVGKTIWEVLLQDHGLEQK